MGYKLVKNKIMYHYHKIGCHDDIWQVGNSFDMSNDFVSSLYAGTYNFSTSVLCSDDSLVSFDRIINDYMKKFDELNKKTILGMLEDARVIIINANILKREFAMEEYRKLYFPDLPSRKNSIWVADEGQIDFWEKELLGGNKQLELFKVELSGKLFKSSDKFIPDDHLSYGECIVKSKKYWNPVFNTQEEENCAEYLFNGKVKILERIK